MWIKSYGIINVSSNRVACTVGFDLVRYYRELIYHEFPNLRGGLSFSRFWPHITIANPKLHLINESAALKWNNAVVEFNYSTDIYLGGFSKGFVGFYTKIESFMLDKIKDDVMLFDQSGSSLHLSICTSKSSCVNRT